MAEIPLDEDIAQLEMESAIRVYPGEIEDPETYLDEPSLMLDVMGVPESESDRKLIQVRNRT